MLDSIATALILGGVAVLGLAASLTCRLVNALPAGPLRRAWYLLLGLVAFFILGYLGYLVSFAGRHASALNLIVPAVFFMGAGFVALVARLMLRTTWNLRRMSVLETESITDALTGLYNRRDFERRWSAEGARAERLGVPLALLVIDVDHFKSVNDAYGHAVGDQVLMAVGRTIRTTLRESDAAARRGGEEFAVVAPYTRPGAAAALGERIRVAVERDALHALGQRADERNITVSIGVAACEKAAPGCERMLERADEALYAAKGAGRNRVVVAGSVNVGGRAIGPNPIAADGS